MSDRMRASYVALVAALRAEFGAAALEAMRIQLIPHRFNPTSLSVLVQAVGDARDVTFATDELEPLAEIEQDRDRLSELAAEQTKALERIHKLAFRMRNSHSVFAEITLIAEEAEPNPQAVTQ